jgi:hypothetical protein
MYLAASLERMLSPSLKDCSSLFLAIISRIAFARSSLVAIYIYYSIMLSKAVLITHDGHY